jgi:hypothetical protein
LIVRAIESPNNKTLINTRTFKQKHPKTPANNRFFILSHAADLGREHVNQAVSIAYQPPTPCFTTKKQKKTTNTTYVIAIRNISDNAT